MKLKLIACSSLALFCLGTGSAAPAKTDGELIAEARAKYPLKTCVVSDEKLDSLEEAVGYIHRAAGQPERVVFLCCDGCIDDFKQDPAKYLRKLDAAAKPKPAPKRPASRDTN